MTSGEVLASASRPRVVPVAEDSGKDPSDFSARRNPRDETSASVDG
jgi:hypothetical protein